MEGDWDRQFLKFLRRNRPDVLEDARRCVSSRQNRRLWMRSESEAVQRIAGVLELTGELNDKPNPVPLKATRSQRPTFVWCREAKDKYESTIITDDRKLGIIRKMKPSIVWRPMIFVKLEPSIRKGAWILDPIGKRMEHVALERILAMSEVEQDTMFLRFYNDRKTMEKRRSQSTRTFSEDVLGVFGDSSKAKRKRLWHSESQKMVRTAPIRSRFVKTPIPSMFGLRTTEKRNPHGFTRHTTIGRPRTVGSVPFKYSNKISQPMFSKRSSMFGKRLAQLTMEIASCKQREYMRKVGAGTSSKIKFNNRSRSMKAFQMFGTTVSQKPWSQKGKNTRSWTPMPRIHASTPLELPARRSQSVQRRRRRERQSSIISCSSAYDFDFGASPVMAMETSSEGRGKLHRYEKLQTTDFQDHMSSSSKDL